MYCVRNTGGAKSERGDRQTYEPNPDYPAPTREMRGSAEVVNKIVKPEYSTNALQYGHKFSIIYVIKDLKIC